MKERETIIDLITKYKKEIIELKNSETWYRAKVEALVDYVRDLTEVLESNKNQ